MKRFAQENLVSILLLLIVLAFLAVSFSYGPRARLVPVPVAILCLILVVSQLIVHNTGGDDKLKVDVLGVVTRGKGAAKTAEEIEQVEDAAEEGRGGGTVVEEEDSLPWWRHEWMAVLLVICFTGLVWLVGPLAGIFVFAALYFVTFSGYRWYYGVVFSGLLTLVLWLLFVVLLETQLYYGVLSPIFLP